MKLTRSQMLLMGSCMLGLASVMLQACSEKEDTRTAMCGNWESVAGKPDMLIFKEGEAYKVTLFKRKGISRKLTPETYLLQQEDNGNLFINTGFRIDVAYNEATDVITFFPNGDYIRVRTEQEKQ